MKQQDIRKILFSFMLVFVTSLSALSQQSLWVGESYKFDVSSSITGYYATANISWSTSGGYLSLSGSGFYRDITVTKYFPGTATVTCEWDYKVSSNGKYNHTKKEVKISCKDNKVSISPTSMTLSPEEKNGVSCKHEFDNQYVSSAKVTFQSSDPSVVRVNESFGQVTAVGTGTAYITVYSNLSSISSSCLVTVNKIDPSSVSIPKNLSITAGDSITITPTLFPSNAQTSFSWTSSNTEVATVNSSGEVYAKKYGQSTITVRTGNGLTASCDVTVNKSKLRISASLEEGLYQWGKVLKLNCNVSGADIYYTTDGSNPTKESILYTGSIEMTEDMSLRAIAMHSDFIDSDILSKEYKVTELSHEEVFPNQNNINISDIHLPYIVYNTDLSSNIDKSLILFTIDDAKIDFIPSVIKNKLYFIPENMNSYKGNHTCKIQIEPYAFTNIDGEPNLPINCNWTTKASTEYYSVLPISIYANYVAPAYLSANGTLNTWGSWPSENYGGAYYNISKSFTNVKSSCVGADLFAYIDNQNNLWVAGNDGWVMPYQNSPILYETDVIDVAYASEATLFFVKSNGDLYGIGSDRFNQLLGKGDKEKYDVKYADTPIKLMDNVKTVVSRDRNCAVIKNDGSLWMWGSYNSSHSNLSSPKKISENVKQVSIGRENPVTFVMNDNTGWYVDDKTLALRKIGNNIVYINGSKDRGFYITSDNKLYGWGRNDHGQLGNGTLTSYFSTRTLPEDATFIMDNVSQVSSDFDYTLALTKEGEVYGWGSNSYYRLDKNQSTTHSQTTPLLLYSPVTNTSIRDLIVPEEFTVILNGYYYIPVKSEPMNGVFSNINWVSSDESIATIDEKGTIYAKSVGECEVKIMIQPFDETSVIEKTVRLKVEKDLKTELNEIILSDESLEMTVGDTHTLTYTITPAYAKSKLIWTSSDSKVAAVENGVVTAVSEGSATITCTANDGSGVSASCSVMVLPYNPVSASEIEGNYQFFLGDFFRDDDSLAMIAGAGSIKIDGKSALLEIDVLNGINILAEYNEESGSLIFTQKLLREVNVDGTSYFCRFEPYFYDEDGWPSWTDYFISYDKTRESFVFPDGHGFILAAYTDAECTQYVGFFDAYLVSCLMKDTEAEGKWIDYDTATYKDGWILPAFEYDPKDYPWTVSVQQNVDNPNLFRISNPYAAEGCPVRDYVVGKGNIVFDLSYPENVMVPTGHYCGLMNGQNLIEPTNRLGYYWGNDSYVFGSYASLQDSMSSWNVASTYDSMTGTVSFNDCQFMISGDDGLYIWMDKQSMMNGQLVFDSKRTGTITGDADDNGKVDIGDAVVICNHYVGKTDDINQTAADVTGDGRIDVQDALAVCNIYLGKSNQKKSKQLTIKRNENQKVYDRRSLRPLGADCQRRLRNHGERITQGVVH